MEILSEGFKPANATSNMQVNQITANAAKTQSRVSVDKPQRPIDDNSQQAAPMNDNIQAARAQSNSTTLATAKRPFRALGTGVVSAMRWARNSTPLAGNVDSKIGKSGVA